MAIAVIVEKRQVPVTVGQIYSLTCGFAVTADIHSRIQILKTGG
jgi:hypothetical protein